MGLKYRKTAQIQINTKRKYTKRRMGTIGRTIGVYVCGEADQEVKIDRERERKRVPEWVFGGLEKGAYAHINRLNREVGW